HRRRRAARQPLHGAAQGGAHQSLQRLPSRQDSQGAGRLSGMPILETQIDRNSADYRSNREHMLAAIAEFPAAEASGQPMAEKTRARFAKRKQLMPRER